LGPLKGRDLTIRSGQLDAHRYPRPLLERFQRAPIEALPLAA
jgi:hypothetical protein